MLLSTSIGLVFISSWVSLAHFISLGILDPLHSFGHLWSIPFLHSHGLFSKSFGLPRPNYHIFYFWDLLAFAPTPFTNSFLWAPLTHPCLLFVSYDSHELTTSFLGAPLGPFTFFGAFLLFGGSAFHCFCHLSLMVLLT